MPFEPLKVDIDPVFKGQPNPDEKPAPQTGVYDALKNQEYTPSEIDQTRKALNEINHNEKSSIVRTYRDDIASAIQASHLSSINIAIAENEKMHGRIDGSTKGEGVATNQSSKKKMVILVGVLVVAIMTIIIGVTYLMNRGDKNPAPQTQIPVAFITTEYKDELNVNTIVKDRFVSALSSRLNDIQIPVNNLYNTYITTGASSSRRLITTQEFITLAGLDTPDLIKRTLTSDFMIGMFSFDQNRPFLILKTTSFENTYAGMLDWEKDLESNFTVLFRLNGGANLGIAAALTPSPIHKFEDAIVANQDARVLRDKDQKITFLYAILNKDTIVITVSDQTLKEIISRLNKEKGAKR